MMDDHGVASCPARYNWNNPQAIVSPQSEVTIEAPPEAVPVVLGARR